MKKQELRQRLDKQAFQATDSEFFQGQYPDETKQKLRYTFSRLVLAYSHGRQIPVPEAASELAPLIRDHAFALLRAHAAGRGQKVAQSQNTPLPGPRGMSPGKGNNVISNEDAKKSGFKNSLDAALSKGGIIRARH